MKRNAMRWLCLPLAIAALAGQPAVAAAAAVPAATKVVDTEVARLAAGAGGVVGIAAWRLDGKGPRILLNADAAFPMASTFKVPLAGKIFDMVDKGQLRLDQMLDVPQDMMSPSEVIADRFIHPGVSLSVHNLLEVMLTQSDNTATDVLMKAAGGPAAVTAWVRAQGVSAMRLDRDTNRLLRDFYRLGEGPLTEAFETAAKADPALLTKGSRPDAAFDADPRDTSSPAAMAALLTRMFAGKALSAESTKAFTAIMERCRTGMARLPGRMPPGTTIARKTGTIGGTVNDVGMVSLPDGTGVVIAAYVKESAAPTADRERAIAEIARTVRDYFLFAN
ncbi:class A beta-lactamase [Sphingosinicella soli]|uniref:beta-lactamase n=1 Tax=Sphingosinicella soli TaxID=333708 RepID=A0A7W7B316_9SPHN|nr:class A beta-lactamase [Sphingosinicella soli]MBB4632057.1 beta-lactamase class A [Sphingosinicella soli]